MLARLAAVFMTPTGMPPLPQTGVNAHLLPETPSQPGALKLQKSQAISPSLIDAQPPVLKTALAQVKVFSLVQKKSILTGGEHPKSALETGPFWIRGSEKLV